MRRLVVLAVVTVALAVPGQASAFSWSRCSSNEALKWNTLSVSPDPITGSGAALPFRWEVSYDPVTKAITHSEFVVGAADGAAPAGLHLRYPNPANSFFTGTYAGTPSGLPVPPAFYSTPAGGVTVDGVTAQWTALVTQTLDASVVGGGARVTLERQFLGVFVQLPGVTAESVPLTGLGAGNYYMKAELLDASSNVQQCTEMYFTTAGESTAPVVYLAEPFAFSGFFSPVDNPSTVNAVKAGSSVPVKFSLGGNKSLEILAAGSPYSEKTDCNGGALDEIEQTATAGSSGLQYDASTGTYTYVWKTEKSWAGKCRTLHVKLIDGTDHTALFKFR
jgi:hypothetical protein